MNESVVDEILKAGRLQRFEQIIEEALGLLSEATTWRTPSDEIHHHVIELLSWAHDGHITVYDSSNGGWKTEYTKPSLEGAE